MEGDKCCLMSPRCLGTLLQPASGPMQQVGACGLKPGHIPNQQGAQVGVGGQSSASWKLGGLTQARTPPPTPTCQASKASGGTPITRA